MKVLDKYIFLSSLALISSLRVESTSTPSCELGMWKCGNGSCIPYNALCDGIKHCPKGEDERYCSKTSCSTGYYQCINSGCIPNYKVCDGYEDCYYGDDESNCGSCSSSEFQCSDGECIPEHWVCDNYNDCIYGEDEINCDISTTDESRSTLPPTCAPNQFQCWNGNCIQGSYLCDGYPDCSQGEDELDCAKTTPVPPSSCENPFDLVGGRCVFIDPVTSATWNEARYVCQMFDGDLAVLDSVTFYSDLVSFIYEKGLISRDYWVGGINSGLSGQWEWLNGMDVRMGTPLWAIYGSGSSYYEQEPRGNSYSVKGENSPKETAPLPSSNSLTGESCALLDKTRYFYMDDYDCLEMKSFICQIPTWKGSLASTSTTIPNVTDLSGERLKELLATLKREKNL